MIFTFSYSIFTHPHPPDFGLAVPSQPRLVQSFSVREMGWMSDFAVLSFWLYMHANTEFMSICVYVASTLDYYFLDV